MSSKHSSVLTPPGVATPFIHFNSFEMNPRRREVCCRLILSETEDSPLASENVNLHSSLHAFR
jgi:hypothetical protein